ncbi:MAG: DUF3014 domain-containing protein [Pseudomonadales bacterium]|nr:DUF3014 domain-containing protein [Pseudomonadales bacterium]MBO6595001.1 DUF3014 domain-containing protein [Pseudomonadales bacterium]MBO6657438.1 DUF3014 domain-containing protein [Pseudomonadales bacterium]MBO6821440.1 DUF3014 domain-containing protein [Pseudomonadales bacterium]
MPDNKPIIITLVIVVAAIIGVIVYFVTSTEPEPTAVQEIAIPAPPAVPDPEPEPEAEPEPEVEPDPVVELPPEPEVEEEPAFVLPLLDDSDSLIRDGAVSLTRHEGVNGWLAPSQLIRKFVAFVDNVAHGQVAKEPVRQLTPEGPFLVKRIDEDTFELDPASYDRYNLATEVAISVDARRAAEFYHLLRPLIQEAYSELGYGETSFDNRMFEAIGRLLETPVIEDPIRLVQPVVMYKYEDEKLESLSAVQKQMIRMGPRNTRLIQNKIREISLELRAILGR